MIFCYINIDFRSRFAIKDAFRETEFCSGVFPPETYKSKDSSINLIYRHWDGSTYTYAMGEIKGRVEGFRLHYKISDHSFQRYTTEVKGSDSGLISCSGLLRKCYTVFHDGVSWDIANRKCRQRSEHLVTIASRMEMNYIQYLLRFQLYDHYSAWYRRRYNKPYGAHIGLRRLTDKNKKTSFNWVNGNSVTFTAW
ncbi:uncharacterized protein LOC132740897 [Ruditapes philippinarum]|uniref:uncharacterized protein LOC132740897 n=1 Tax=Ruditapes philippinarum TaxID=129788 RepID=UPI00295C26F2|nr:uncharacterized protein LOC132740897 [Ruditapes philippinarum]